MTRTVFFGKPTTEQKKIYETVLQAQQKAIDLLGTNRNASKIDNAARDYIASKGYPSIPHSLGHGIGINVHELPHISPNSKDILKDGMVFSIEPGIYLPNFGGVRIEDLVVLEKKGIRLLTHSPKILIEV
jgi:Xaa-Pro aminopeptidase